MLTRRRVGSALLGAFSVLGGARLSAFAQSIPDNRADQIKAAGKTMAFAAPGGDLGRILKAILADFTADTGIRVNYLEGPLLDIYGRIKAERTRPSIDVYVASSVTEAKGIQEGMYTPIDPKIVTNLAKVTATIVITWALGLGSALAESCFETRFALINQVVSIAANDTNAAVQYKVCLTGERITSADILNPTSTLVTLESSPEGNETGCAFVISNKSLTARLITYEGSTSKANATLNVCVLP